MSQITWDVQGERTYEAGVDHGVLYVTGKSGVPWNGLISISEKPSGADPTPIYADNIKYLTLISPEDFSATLEAYTYPDEFAECDGYVDMGQGMVISAQPRKTFGLSYRTGVGSDTKGMEHGFKLHLIYGCLASPSERSYSTLNDSPDVISFSWELATNAMDVPGHSPTAHVILESKGMNAQALKAVENILYGTASDAPRMPSPSELLSILSQDWEDLIVTDNGDGTFTLEGPDSVVELMANQMFQLNSSSVTMVDQDTFQVSSI